MSYFHLKHNPILNRGQNFLRGFRYQSVSKPQIPPKVVPPNQTNRPSPGPSIGSSQSPGALSDASAGIARVVRGLLRSEKDGLLAYPWGLSSSLPPSGTAVLFECGLGLVHECGVPASSCFTASSQPWEPILLIDVHRTAHDNQPIETSHFW